MLQWIADNLPMLLSFVLGVGLLVVEILLPGFGLPGIGGIVLQVLSVVLAWMTHSAMAALGMALLVLSVDAVAISFALRSAAKGKLSKSKIILRDRENSEEGYRSSQDMEAFLGKEGLTATVLRPTGMADFDGVRLSVVSEGEFIQTGVKVRIVNVDGNRILVRAVAA